ncbi:MAG: hypothetical protein ACRDRJ_29200, partial [Streptosporangiaceae bacterium]
MHGYLPVRYAGLLALTRRIVLGAVVAGASLALAAALAACGSPALAPGTRSVVSAPARIAHTRLGAVGY